MNPRATTSEAVQLRRRRASAAGATIVLVLLAGLGGPGLLSAADLGPQDMANMMQGMSSMMKLWNAFSSSGGSGSGTQYWPSGSADSYLWSGLGANAWPGRWGAPGPGLPPAVPPVPRFGGYPGFGGGAPWAGVPGPWAGRRYAYASGLDGLWQGSSGEVLAIRGKRFRLTAGKGQQLDGTFMLTDSRLIAYIPALDETRQYRFERRGDMFALQDEQGQILVFKRR